MHYYYYFWLQFRHLFENQNLCIIQCIIGLRNVCQFVYHINILLWIEAISHLHLFEPTAASVYSTHRVNERSRRKHSRTSQGLPKQNASPLRLLSRRGKTRLLGRLYSYYYYYYYYITATLAIY